MLLFLFLSIESYSLVPAAITQISSSIAELVFPIGILNKETKSKIEIHPVIVEDKIRTCSIQFRAVQTFLCFLLINSFCSISSRK